MPNFSLSWIEKFEEEFSVHKLEEDAVYNIIEGQSLYLQKLQDISFAVFIDKDIKQFFNKNDCRVYDNFDVVAFLVTNWIKIQDSLEMIFNLLSASSEKSLQILSYLRINKISAPEFALYLYLHRKIILINRFKKDRISNLDNTTKLLDNLNEKCNYLVVGNRDYKTLAKHRNVKNLLCAIHPSGRNLNKDDDKYFNTWYKLDSTQCRNNTDNFKLLNFSRLK